MSARPRGRRGNRTTNPVGVANREGGPDGTSPSAARQAGAAAERRGPRLLHYLYLNLALWLFLAMQGAMLSRSLGSSQSVWLFTGLLGLGFLTVSVFDYVWLRLRN